MHSRPIPTSTGNPSEVNNIMVQYNADRGTLGRFYASSQHARAPRKDGGIGRIFSL